MRHIHLVCEQLGKLALELDRLEHRARICLRLCKVPRSLACYRQSWTNDEAGADLSEWRIFAEASIRAFLPGDLLLTLRNRGDLRWLEGEYSWRYRPRLLVERETDLGPVSVVPYASAEVFWDSRYDAWSRARYQNGLAVPVTKWLAPEVYYALQTDWQPTWKDVHAVGLVTTLYF